METQSSLRRSAVLAVVVFAACGDRPSVETPEAQALLDGSGPWTVTASDGSHVTMTAGTTLLPGPVSLTFSVHEADGPATVVSLDLVSPTMPMHGLVRYPVIDGSAEIDIPMEGSWTIYANLDDTGEVSAEFVLDVPPGESTGHQHHGGE